MTGYFTNAVSIDGVLAEKPEKIYYGALTCWWTHNPNHLGRLDSGIPCDPRGGVLLETDDPDAFFKAAKENAEHYGKHKLRAFVAAHHENCIVSREDKRNTCFQSWDDYNRIIDESEAGEGFMEGH